MVMFVQVYGPLSESIAIHLDINVYWNHTNIYVDDIVVRRKTIQ